MASVRICNMSYKQMNIIGITHLDLVLFFLPAVNVCTFISNGRLFNWLVMAVWPVYYRVTLHRVEHLHATFNVKMVTFVTAG